MATPKKKKNKYSKKAEKKIATVMREYESDTLHSGKSKKKVKNRKQALAIALSSARRKGLRVPKDTSVKRKKK